MSRGRGTHMHPRLPHVRPECFYAYKADASASDTVPCLGAVHACHTVHDCWAWCTAEVQAASLGVTPSHKLLTMRSLRRGEHAFSRALHPVEKARRCSSIIAAVHNMLLTHSSPQCPLFFGKAEATAASGHFPITLNHSTAFSSV